MSGIFKRIQRALVLVVVIVLVNVFTQNGSVMFSFGGLYATNEGLTRGMYQGARLITMLWGGFLLVSSTSLEEFLDAGERWTRQKGRPLFSAGTIAICYMPVLVESARRIAVARRARGEADLPGFLSGLRRAGTSALPLFASALRNADSLAEAMEARCYDPSLPRSQFRLTPIPMIDVACLLLVFGVTIAALFGFL
jgi:energy-coupling factor transport system permease protein